MIFLPVKQSFYNYMTVKIAGANFKEGLDHIQKVWKSFLPVRPFEYQFTTDRYQKLYDAEQKENQLFTIFSGLAIFIASLSEIERRLPLTPQLMNAALRHHACCIATLVRNRVAESAAVHPALRNARRRAA